MGNANLPPGEMIASVVQTLTESVPMDYLMKNESVDIVADKLRSSLQGSEVDKEQIVKIAANKENIYKEEMMEVLDVILDKVFASRNESS